MNVPVPTLDRSGIAARIPHSGAMCLLDRMVECAAAFIHCQASGHGDPQHPLRGPAGLPACCGIEYAAQAMALHGALLADADAAPQAGFLASARAVRQHVARLDDAAGPIAIRAQRLSGNASQALYAFELRDANGSLLVDGRATVVLKPGPGGARR